MGRGVNLRPGRQRNLEPEGDRSPTRLVSVACNQGEVIGFAADLIGQPVTKAESHVGHHFWFSRDLPPVVSTCRPPTAASEAVVAGHIVGPAQPDRVFECGKRVAWCLRIFRQILAIHGNQLCRHKRAQAANTAARLGSPTLDSVDLICLGF